MGGAGPEGRWGRGGRDGGRGCHRRSRPSGRGAVLPCPCAEGSLRGAGCPAEPGRRGRGHRIAAAPFLRSAPPPRADRLCGTKQPLPGAPRGPRGPVGGNLDLPEGRAPAGHPAPPAGSRWWWPTALISPGTPGSVLQAPGPETLRGRPTATARSAWGGRCRRPRQPGARRPRGGGARPPAPGLAGRQRDAAWPLPGRRPRGLRCGLDAARCAGDGGQAWALSWTPRRGWRGTRGFLTAERGGGDGVSQTGAGRPRDPWARAPGQAAGSRDCGRGARRRLVARNQTCAGVLQSHAVTTAPAHGASTSSAPEDAGNLTRAG